MAVPGGFKFTLALSTGNVDITPEVVDFRVRYGTAFDPYNARWKPETSKGHIVISTHTGRFTEGHADNLLTDAELTGPLTLTFGSTAEPTVWSGQVLARPVIPIDPAADMAWAVTGTYDTVLGAPFRWRHVSYTDTVASYPDPLTFARNMIDAAGRQAGIGVAPFVGAAFPPSRVMVDAASVGPGVEWIYPRVNGTLVQNWSEIARYAGCIPYVTHTGRVGMKSIPTIRDGTVGAVPASQSFQLPSQLRIFPKQAPWELELAGSMGQAAGPVSTLATIMVTLDDRDDDTTEFVGTGTIDVPFGTGVADVLWQRSPTAPAGATKVTVTVEPLIGSNADRLTVEVRASTRPSGPITVPLMGRTITTHETTSTPIRSGDGPYQPLPDPGWINYSSTEPPELTAFTAWVEVLNNKFYRLQARYPLLDTSIAQRTPGTLARYGIDPERELQAMCELVELRWRNDRVPTATITAVDLFEVGILGPGVAPPKPPPPPVMYPGTPATASDPHGSVGTFDHMRWVARYDPGVELTGQNFYRVYDALGNYSGGFTMDLDDGDDPFSPNTLSFQQAWPLGRYYVENDIGGNSLAAVQRTFSFDFEFHFEIGDEEFDTSAEIINHSRGLPTSGVQGVIVHPNDFDSGLTDAALTTLLSAQDDINITLRPKASGRGDSRVPIIHAEPAPPPMFELPDDVLDNTDEVVISSATNWNGTAESNRSNTFMVVHTAENNGAFAAGTRHNVRDYLLGIQHYAGYHIIVDVGGFTIFQDPRTRRAYHALQGNDGIGLCFAGKTTDWANLSTANRNLLFGFARQALVNVAQNRKNWVLATDTSTANGIVTHAAIQDDRTDPGWSATDAATFMAFLNF